MRDLAGGCTCWLFGVIAELRPLLQNRHHVPFTSYMTCRSFHSFYEDFHADRAEEVLATTCPAPERTA